MEGLSLKRLTYSSRKKFKIGLCPKKILKNMVNVRKKILKNFFKS